MLLFFLLFALLLPLCTPQLYGLRIEKFVSGGLSVFYANPTNAADPFPNSLNFGDVFVYNSYGLNMARGAPCTSGNSGFSGAGCSLGVDGSWNSGVTSPGSVASGDSLSEDWWVQYALFGDDPPLSLTLVPRPGATCGRLSNTTLRVTPPTGI